MADAADRTTPIATGDGLTLYGDAALRLTAGDGDVVGELARHLARRRSNAYLCLQAFIAPTPARDEAFARHPGAAARPDRPGDDGRLRAALPALDRPAPQGRRADRLVPPADRGPPGRRRDPRTGRTPSASSSTPRRPATSPPSSRTTCRSCGSTSARTRTPGWPPSSEPWPPPSTPARRPDAMRIGFIGLGRMGANMVRRLVRDGHEIVIYNRTPEKTREIAAEEQGATASFSIAELVGRAREAARGLGHGPGRRRHRGADRRAARAPRAGRHDHRRRQHELPRRRPPARRAQGQGHPLRRRRDVGRDLGPPGRLLPDGRRRGRRRSTRSSRSSPRSRPPAATSTSAGRAPGTT